MTLADKETVRAILASQPEAVRFYKLLSFVISLSKAHDNMLRDMFTYGQHIRTPEQSEALGKWALRYTNRLLGVRV